MVKETFHFFVVSGKVTKGYDSNGLADPYVKMGFISKKTGKTEFFLKTKVCKKTLLPEFQHNQDQELETDDIEKMVIEMYDNDLIGKDDFIGKTTLGNISYLTKEGTLQRYNLFNENDKELAGGPSANVYLGMSKK
ncbi:hypothetical protein RB653_001503 [Dictyostelium firmibasis]|uniref:C2 domain-containing protein n=1 Tax=Dictyostelium firmibasis TaxID=79012 RepID=A0AAN7U489_9MYCE